MAAPVPFKILGKYDKQKFRQFNPEDTANWYLAISENGKNKIAMYPSPGRKHVSFLNQNRLIFNNEPRGLFKTFDFFYVVDGSNIYKVDSLFNQIIIGTTSTLSTPIFFTYLIVGSIIFACFVDGQHLYIYREDNDTFYTVTDANLPSSPIFIATFGNRLVVSGMGSSQFNLSVINLGGSGFNPASCFTPAIFATENGIIRQLAVFKNLFYIFTDYSTGIWLNQPSIFSGSGVTFPFKKNTSYEWEYGLLDPLSLDVGFTKMTWLGQNSDGLVQVLLSVGDNPKPISTKAIDLLFQPNDNLGALSPFVEAAANGFMYQLDNTVLYRLSAGTEKFPGILDYHQQANAIEYNFDSESWHRVIELDGSRNKINKHIYFNNMHLVTVQGETTLYQMSDQFYINELKNISQPNNQAPDAYNPFPFRYERVTPIIREEDDGEFITDWVQVDFVWGLNDFIRSNQPFENTQFIITETPDANNNPVYMVSESDPNTFMIAENTNFPTPNDQTYYNFYKPHIELYWSDDGGIYYHPADVLEFSQLGFYLWRMRWYQLGVSRCRTYKLICVSPAPVVVLGGLMSIRRASGGAS